MVKTMTGRTRDHFRASEEKESVGHESWNSAAGGSALAACLPSFFQLHESTFYFKTSTTWRLHDVLKRRPDPAPPTRVRGHLSYTVAARKGANLLPGLAVFRASMHAYASGRL